MEPIKLSTQINLPREQVFEYLADIANHAEFTDHYLVDWHLTRVDSVGVGAGARFRIQAPLNRFARADLAISDMQAPLKIVKRGSGGKYNRIKMVETYEIEEVRPGVSKVQYTYESEAHMPSDLIREALGGRAWTRRQAKRALHRLRMILEQDRMRGSRPTVAAS
ncbi:MAG: SRPBCC family protein [Solirubrobacteraceae bacterium]